MDLDTIVGMAMDATCRLTELVNGTDPRTIQPARLCWLADDFFRVAGQLLEAADERGAPAFMTGRDAISESVSVDRATAHP